jgi:hypothetical protein
LLVLSHGEVGLSYLDVNDKAVTELNRRTRGYCRSCTQDAEQPPLKKCAHQQREIVDGNRITRPRIWQSHITMDAVLACLKIRNQYAPCNWAETDPKAGLFFADLQDSATRQDWFTNWKHVDVPLLARQKAFLQRRSRRPALSGSGPGAHQERMATQPWASESLVLPEPPLHNSRKPTRPATDRGRVEAKRAKEAREGKHSE